MRDVGRDATAPVEATRPRGFSPRRRFPARARLRRRATTPDDLPACIRPVKLFGLSDERERRDDDRDLHSSDLRNLAARGHFARRPRTPFNTDI